MNEEISFCFIKFYYFNFFANEMTMFDMCHGFQVLIEFVL